MSEKAKGNDITQHYFDFDEPVIRPKSMKKEAVAFASCGISIGFGFNNQYLCCIYNGA